MKLKLFLTRKSVSDVLYRYISHKSTAKKSEVSTKVNVYSYRRAHRHASCSAGVICSCSVVTCSCQSSNSILGTCEKLEFLYRPKFIIKIGDHFFHRLTNS